MDKSECLILAIETSCDETSAAVLKNGRLVLSNIISSQIETHKKYGGVVPEIASRQHIENIGSVVNSAMIAANVTLDDIDAICVANGPGLVGALLVGVSFAKSLAFAANKPLIGVSHIEGHICANYINEAIDQNINDEFKPPFVCLVVSGGHTDLLFVPNYGVYEVLGQTRDDAAGEAFDKVARVLGLPYPGGPQIEEIAKKGNEFAIAFPQALLKDASLDFSFSGLKSAVLNYVNKAKMMGEAIDAPSVAASFQKAVVDVLVAKTIAAAKMKQTKSICMAGGVSSNGALRAALKLTCHENGITLHVPSPVFCTDNAAMIAACGYFHYKNGNYADYSLNAVPNLKFFS